ncbi:MAG: ASKHA domain-containing protein [Thermincolia bacterium]
MQLTVMPDNVTIEVNEGENLLKALDQAGIVINSSCGGRGTCGRCVVDMVSGDIRSEYTKSKKVGQGQVLSCKATIHSDATVSVPNDGRRLSSHKVLINEVELDNPFGFDSLFRKIHLTLPEPSLTDNTDDLSRLMVELRKETGLENIRVNLAMMRKLPFVLREGKWQVTVGLNNDGQQAVIIDLEPGHVTTNYYGLAIDIGTTTIKMNLIDLTTGKTVAAQGEYNRQQKYGDDVINRIVYSAEEKDGLKILQKAVIDSINTLINRMLKENNIEAHQIYASVVASNTTMTHLFMGIYANYIRLEPYIPAASVPQCVYGEELGLVMNPKGLVYNLPAVGSYVGGDITSGVLSTQLARKEILSLLIDIGTNGEIVLGNQDFQISCACSAGPTFEGGGIKYGMRAMDGAIDKMEITEGCDSDAGCEVTVSTINHKKPVGICGSGLIDAIATLLEVGIIDRTGSFVKSQKNPRLRHDEEEGWEFVLVWGKDTEHSKDITLLESDIKNVIRAKGAIFAGIRSLLKHMSMSVEDIDELLIAGGFGNSLNIKEAVTIGMLPDLPLEKYRYVGNTSLKGAQLSLTSKEAYSQVMEFAKGMTYLELSVGNDFMDEFVSASFLPHTDLTLFPSFNKK